MDEEKQLQPALKHKAALLKLLLPLDIILVVITLLTSLFIILEAILSSHGIILNFSNYGHSMDPTIKGNALCAFDTTVPFDELKSGDIISFKERTEHHMASASITVHITKGDGNEDIDSVPVMESGFIGKMLWHIDYIGSVLLFLYQNFMVITAVSIVLTTCTLLLRRSVSSVSSLRDK